MFFITFDSLVGAAVGAVVVVVSSKAYAWVKKQVTSVEADAAPVVAKAEAAAANVAATAVKTAVADVAKKL